MGPSKAINALLRIHDRSEELAKRANCKGIVIVNVPADETNEQFFESFSNVPWLTIDIKEKYRLKELIERFRVVMIPHIPILKLVGNEVQILNPNSANELLFDVELDNFPYIPSPITDLNKSLDSYGYNINTQPSIVFLMELSHSDSIKFHVYESLVEIAKAFSTDKIQDIEGPRFLFYFAFEQCDQADRIRELCRLPKLSPSDKGVFHPILLILDFASGGSFYMKDFQKEENESVVLNRLVRAAGVKEKVTFESEVDEELKNSRSALTGCFIQFIKDYENMKLEASYIL